MGNQETEYTERAACTRGRTLQDRRLGQMRLVQFGSSDISSSAAREPSKTDGLTQPDVKKDKSGIGPRGFGSRLRGT
jgi:hypothetical protein